MKRLLVCSLVVATTAACTGAAREGLAAQSIDSEVQMAAAEGEEAGGFSRAGDTPCRVTLPNRSSPSNPLQHSNEGGTLWTELWPEGQVIFEPDGPGTIHENGFLEMKWPWTRHVDGGLKIEGRRLDGPAPPLMSNVLDGYGQTGFQSSLLVFPTEGCWEVTGRVGDATLTFVMMVIRVREVE